MPEHQQTQQSTESKTTFQKQATPQIQAPISHPMAIIQRARINPKSLTHADVMQLQRTIGNRAVVRLFSEIGLIPSTAKQAPPVQRQEMPEEEEPLQGKMAKTIQRQTIPEEEEPLQGKMIEPIQRQEIPKEDEPLQGKFENKPEQMTCPSCFAAPVVQRQELEDEEKPLQGKMIETIQRQEIPEEEEPLQTKTENNTGMPDNLKAGVESLSGIDMSDVRVHYNSNKPADVGALAYTQGQEIHVASGQEKHLPHEAWHVVQQAQGRVRPTMQLKDKAVNDDLGLEREADLMGTKVLQKLYRSDAKNPIIQANVTVVQRQVAGFEYIKYLDDIPDGWADAYLEDIADIRSRVHLDKTDIDSFIGTYPEGVEVKLIENHFFVIITKNGTPINVDTMADGNCAAHAAHAVQHNQEIKLSQKGYMAPEEFIIEFRQQAKQSWGNPEKKGEIKTIILNALKYRDTIAETGFGTQLMLILEPIAEKAEREKAERERKQVVTATTKTTQAAPSSKRAIGTRETTALASARKLSPPPVKKRAKEKLAAAGTLRRSSRARLPTLRLGGQDLIYRSVYDNIQILYQSLKVPEGGSGGEQAPDATMKISSKLIHGKFESKKHCETDIYDKVFESQLSLIRESHRGVDEDKLIEMAAKKTKEVLKGKKLTCSTASCLLCSAIMAIFGVKPQTKFKKTYGDYVLPKVITQDPKNMETLLGKEAYKFYMTLSEEQKHLFWGDFMKWMETNT